MNSKENRYSQLLGFVNSIVETENFGRVALINSRTFLALELEQKQKLEFVATDSYPSVEWKSNSERITVNVYTDIEGKYYAIEKHV